MNTSSVLRPQPRTAQPAPPQSAKYRWTPAVLTTLALLLTACATVETPGHVGGPRLGGPQLGGTAGVATSVNITVGDQTSSAVTATGLETHVITDDERLSSTLPLSDDALKSAVNRYFGNTPNDVYLKSPATSDDLYAAYGWPQVQTTRSVQAASVQGVEAQTVTLATKPFSNPGAQDAVINAGMTADVTTTTESNWDASNPGIVSVTQPITYNLTFPGGPQSAFSYTEAWGQNGKQSQPLTLGSASGPQVTLKPQQSVNATLTATLTSVEVQVVHQVSLTGDVVANYVDKYKDHHFWGLPLESILEAVGVSPVQSIVEDVRVMVYSNATITVRDAAGNVLTSLPVK